MLHCTYLSLGSPASAALRLLVFPCTLAGRGGGGGDDGRTGPRVSGNVPHDRHKGADRDEHPAQEGGKLRSPEGHDPILRSRVSGAQQQQYRHPASRIYHEHLV